MNQVPLLLWFYLQTEMSTCLSLPWFGLLFPNSWDLSTSYIFLVFVKSLKFYIYKIRSLKSWDPFVFNLCFPVLSLPAEVLVAWGKRGGFCEKFSSVQQDKIQSCKNIAEGNRCLWMTWTQNQWLLYRMYMRRVIILFGAQSKECQEILC